MAALGVILMLLGLVSGFAVHDHIAAFGQVWDMNLIGWILVIVGAVSLGVGVWANYIYANTRHREEDDITIRRDYPKKGGKN